MTSKEQQQKQRARWTQPVAEQPRSAEQRAMVELSLARVRDAEQPAQPGVVGQVTR